MGNPILTTVGSVALGMLVGWLARFSMFRLKTFTLKTFTGILTVLLGGTATSLLGKNNEWLWWYILGLVLGFLIYSIVGAVARRSEKRANEFSGILYDEEVDVVDESKLGDKGTH